MAVICYLGLLIWIWIFQVDNEKVSARNLSDSDISDIDQFIEKTLSCRHIPGMSVTVVNKDTILLQKGYGYADLEKKIPVDGNTLFPIASTTKAFTTAVLAMVLEGTDFNWDTPLKKIDPKFELHNDILTEHVTLRDILTHRTGIPGYFLSLMAGYPDDMSREELVRSFNLHPPTDELRTQLKYNNFMYALAGFIAEILSGTRWEDIIREHIFKPLNMSSSTFVSELNLSASLPNMAKPYVYYNSENVAIDLTTLRQVEKASPAGAIISNGKDMASWLQFHLRHGKLPSGESLLSSEAMKEMYETPIGGHGTFPPDLLKPTYPVSDISSTYALAWINNVYRGYRRIWHSGGILTYKTQVWLLPDIESAIFVVANGPMGERWSMVNVPMYITDLLTGETPWLDTETVCTFPSPWQPEENEDSESSPYINDPVTNPDKYYIGKYNNKAFGKITIFKNSTTNRLQMNMGQFMEADLMYDKQKDIFVTRLINKYWYLNDKIPLKFGNLQAVGNMKTFSLIYMPLCPPYDTALRLEFKRENFPEYMVPTSCGIKYGCTVVSLCFIKILLIMQAILLLL